MATPVGKWVIFLCFLLLFLFLFFPLSVKVLPDTPLLVVSSCIESSVRILLGLRGLG